MVTSIHSRQLNNNVQLEIRKQDGSCQKIQDPREIKLARKKVRGKMTEKCFEEYHLKVILTLLLKNISSEVIHGDVVVNAMNDKISSISS